jgi:hypothetical protein
LSLPRRTSPREIYVLLILGMEAYHCIEAD